MARRERLALASPSWSHCVRLELGSSNSFQIPHSKTPPNGGVSIYGPPGEMSVGFASLVSPLERLGSNGMARTTASEHPKPKMPTKGRHFRFGPPGEIRTPDTQVRSLVLYPAELRAERLSQSTGREVYHGFSMLTLAHCIRLDATLAAAFGSHSRGGMQ